MSTPETFSFPQELIQAAEAELSKQLIIIINKVLDRELSRVDGLKQGIDILEAHYDMQIQVFNAYVQSKNLRGLSGFEASTREALSEAKASWGRVVRDASNVERKDLS